LEVQSFHLIRRNCLTRRQSADRTIILCCGDDRLAGFMESRGTANEQSRSSSGVSPLLSGWWRKWTQASVRTSPRKCSRPIDLEVLEERLLFDSNGFDFRLPAQPLISIAGQTGVPVIDADGEGGTGTTRHFLVAPDAEGHFIWRNHDPATPIVTVIN